MRVVKRTEHGMIMIRCHVDDLLVVGKEPDATKFFENLSKELRLKYKEVDAATKYLGGHLEKQSDGYVFVVAPTYVDKIIKENSFKDLKGTAEIKWSRGHDDEEMLDDFGQAEFRSMVGQHVDRQDRCTEADRQVGHEVGQGYNHGYNHGPPERDQRPALLERRAADDGRGRSEVR